MVKDSGTFFMAHVTHYPFSDTMCLLYELNDKNDRM